jgi:hypothetical protein
MVASMPTYSSSELYFTLALYQDVYAMCFGCSDHISDLFAHPVHTLEMADVSSLDEMELDCRADHFALVYDSLDGFLIATNNDDSQSSSIMAMGLAKFSNCKFSDSIGCSNEHSSKWLFLNKSAVDGSDGCELDHCE